MTKSLRENDAVKCEKLPKIGGAVQKQNVTLEVDWKDMYQKIKNDKYAVENAGTILYQHYLNEIMELYIFV